MNFSYSILERKNLCLKSFLKITHEFLDQISQNNIEQIEKFSKKRTALIEVLQRLEEETVENELSLEERKKILLENTSLLNQILSIDKRVMDEVLRIKAETVRNLTSIQSGRKTLSAYRSPQDKVEYAENSSIVDQEA